MSRPFVDQDVFTAISHPIRRHIIDLLRQRPRTPAELLEALPRSASTVSAHLRTLRSTGLVIARRLAGRVVYELRSDRLTPAERWLRRGGRSSVARAQRIE